MITEITQKQFAILLRGKGRGEEEHKDKQLGNKTSFLWIMIILLHIEGSEVNH